MPPRRSADPASSIYHPASARPGEAPIDPFFLAGAAAFLAVALTALTAFGAALGAGAEIFLVVFFMLVFFFKLKVGELYFSQWSPAAIAISEPIG